MSARVLVVEDNQDTLELMSALLRAWGYECDEAISATVALRLIDAQCPDVIISDLVMPGMSGLDLLQALRAQRDDCRSAFFLITGHCSVAVAVKAIHMGATEILCKPLDPDALRTRLETHGFHGGST